MRRRREKGMVKMTRQGQNHTQAESNVYIISRLFPVPFSNTYDDSFLVLGIANHHHHHLFAQIN